MYDDVDGPHIDQLIDNSFVVETSPGNHEANFIQRVDNYLSSPATDEALNVASAPKMNVKYEPVATPVPKSFLIARTINSSTSRRILTVLFDSGS